MANHRDPAEIERRAGVDRCPHSHDAQVEPDAPTGWRPDMDGPVSGEFAAILARFGWDTAQ